MAGSCLPALQTAVHTVLIANTALVNALQAAYETANPDGIEDEARIYDDVAEMKGLPYVVHGDAAEEKDDAMARGGKRATFAVHIWSSYLGALEAKQLASLVASALDGVDLTVTGYEHIRTVHDRTTVQRQPDGILRWAAVWFTAFLREAA